MRKSLADPLPPDRHIIFIGLIPIIGQVADGRDLAAYLYRIVFKRQFNDPGNWVGLALTLVGLVPIVSE
ncbi:MAG TPA: hypothetical protein DDW76_27690 [Cyanobacteria bacterium UBA11369]|nr:hypothetical protein [Cyanobacteria bacterium UBA11371]HBE30755.1 hypothetical protein [Cyanobacteria bacterium UBA11368]HBE52450.1 hypothetical protein [Cyanobacteria bacterium UBA11369]